MNRQMPLPVTPSHPHLCPNSSFRCPTSNPAYTKHLSKTLQVHRAERLPSKTHKLIVALGETSSSLTAPRGIRRSFPDSPQVFFFLPPSSMSRCWSSPVMGCGGVTQCANLPLQLKSGGRSFGILPLRFSCAPCLPRGPFSARPLTFSAQSTGC